CRAQAARRADRRVFQLLLQLRGYCHAAGRRPDREDYRLFCVGTGVYRPDGPRRSALLCLFNRRRAPSGVGERVIAADRGNVLSKLHQIARHDDRSLVPGLDRLDVEAIRVHVRTRNDVRQDHHLHARQARHTPHFLRSRMLVAHMLEECVELSRYGVHAACVSTKSLLDRGEVQGLMNENIGALRQVDDRIATGAGVPTEYDDPVGCLEPERERLLPAIPRRALGEMEVAVLGSGHLDVGILVDEPGTWDVVRQKDLLGRVIESPRITTARAGCAVSTPTAEMKARICKVCLGSNALSVKSPVSETK